MRRARTAVAAAVVAALVALGGCSNREAAVNKEPHSGVGVASVVKGVQQIVVHTGISLRFHPSTLIVHQGKVKIILRNDQNPPDGGPPHNLQVTGLPGVYVPTITPGQSAYDVFTAPSPGRYRFVCTIHVAQGQTGVLVVKPGPPPR
jgi:plastocyanin